jgi:hypothetical protein
MGYKGRLVSFAFLSSIFLLPSALKFFFYDFYNSFCKINYCFKSKGQNVGEREIASLTLAMTKGRALAMTKGEDTVSG